MRTRRYGFSLIEMLVVMAIMALILWMVRPIVCTTSVHETAAIREVQTVYAAQVQYLSQFGSYAPSLAALGPPTRGAAGPAAARLIPASLASGEKDGYLFSMEPTPGGFAVNAKPKVFGKTGRRTFCLDENGIVHQNWNEAPATAESPEIK